MKKITLFLIFNLLLFNQLYAQGFVGLGMNFFESQVGINIEIPLKYDNQSVGFGFISQYLPEDTENKDYEICASNDPNYYAVDNRYGLSTFFYNYDFPIEDESTTGLLGLFVSSGSSIGVERAKTCTGEVYRYGDEESITLAGAIVGFRIYDFHLRVFLSEYDNMEIGVSSKI